MSENRSFTPNSLPSTSERCHAAANKLRDFDTQDLEASTHLLVWLGEILNEAEATLRLASFELARSVPSERSPIFEPPSFKKLAHVHRGWCNYCGGNLQICRDAPRSGCSLRDCEVEIENTNAATQDEMPHVGPRTRAESRSSRQHEAVTPPASAAPDVSPDKNYFTPTVVAAIDRVSKRIMDASLLEGDLYELVTVAVKEALSARGDGQDTARLDYMERFIVEGTNLDSGKVVWLADVECLRETIDEAIVQEQIKTPYVKS